MQTSNFKTAGHLPNAVAISRGVPRLLTMAFKKSVRRLRESLPGMPIDLWNEPVFRFTYCQALNAPKSALRLFGECNRIDLVLHWHDELAAAVEFKFYPRRSRYDLHGKLGGFKGGPGRKNYCEFVESAEKLRQCAPANVLKLIALVYADPHNSTGRKWVTSSRLASALTVASNARSICDAWFPLTGFSLRDVDAVPDFFRYERRRDPQLR